MNCELKAKSAVITGASRGIGAAAAIALARAGVTRFVLHYGGYREGAQKILEQVRKEGADGTIVGADLASPQGISELLNAIDPAAGILINNAGSLVERARLPEYTPELFDKVMNLNVKSAYFLAQKLAPHMIERGSGFIINVSSIAARNGGGPGATIYAAAKAAISAITKGLAKELAPKGVRVNAVSPGTVDNHFHETFSTKQMLDAMAANTPAGRLGTNEEVADTIVFLCSESSRFIHGQTIEINGGMYMA